MARLLWTVLCSKTSIDRESNNISLFEVLEQVTVEGPPEDARINLAATSTLVTEWMRSDIDQPESRFGRFSLVGPSGEVFGGVEFEINLSDEVRHRSLINMHTLPLQGPGIYEFVIEIRDDDGGGWQEASRIPLQVLYSQPTS